MKFPWDFCENSEKFQGTGNHLKYEHLKKGLSVCGVRILIGYDSVNSGVEDSWSMQLYNSYMVSLIYNGVILAENFRKIWLKIFGNFLENSERETGCENISERKFSVFFQVLSSRISQGKTPSAYRFFYESSLNFHWNFFRSLVLNYSRYCRISTLWTPKAQFFLLF